VAFLYTCLLASNITISCLCPISKQGSGIREAPTTTTTRVGSGGDEGRGSRRRRVSSPRYVFFLSFFRTILMFLQYFYLRQQQRQGLGQEETRAGARDASQVRVFLIFFCTILMFLQYFYLLGQQQPRHDCRNVLPQNIQFLFHHRGLGQEETQTRLESQVRVFSFFFVLY